MKHPLVVALAVLVFAECALVSAAAIYLVIELLSVKPDSYPSAIFLTIIVIVGAIWLGVIGRNLLRGRAWTRGAAIVWQVLQIAVAVGCFQGAFAVPTIGWLLLVPAVAALVLLFTPPVVAEVSRRD